MKTKLQNFIESIRDEPIRIIYWLVGCLLLFYVLRGCFPGLNSSTLPTEVLDDIQRSNIECISAGGTLFRPGYPQQSECGSFEVEMVAAGTVPTSAQATGITQATCYRIKVDNPRWQTVGNAPIEVHWSSNRYSKVAILQNGKWETFPDEALRDEKRWIEYGCPGPYEAE